MKRLTMTIFILISLIIINNLIRSIYDLWQKQDLIAVAALDLKKEKEHNEQLKKQLAEVKDPGFIEQEARNRLLLGKPGEELVLLPQDQKRTIPASTATKRVIPNWKQWLIVFFDS